MSGRCRKRRSGTERPRGAIDLGSARGTAAGSRAAVAAAAGAIGAAGAATRQRRRLGFSGQQAFALGALARQLAGPADRLRPFPRLLLGWLLVMAAELHLAENPLALHLLL